MISSSFIATTILGALLAVPYCLYASRSADPRRVFGAGLLVAALIYVVFAAAAADGRAALVETAGFGAFGAVVIVGLRFSTYWLAAGWGVHVAWDLLLHPVDHAGYAPGWYPVLCVGFDILVAGFILAVARGAVEADGR